MTSNYSRAVNNELQYSVGADAQIDNSNNTTARASTSYNPWYGTFMANANVGVNRRSVGATESGALIVSEGQVMVSRRSDESFAILHIPDLGRLTIENSFGQKVTVTNRSGYAAIPIASGNTPVLKVAEEELPDNIEVKDSLVVKLDYWQAALWKPAVTQVNRGWMHLMFSNGVEVPLGASTSVKDGEEPVMVLSEGEIYFPDLPAGIRKLELSLPGDVSRCVVDLPEGLKLRQVNTPDKPQFVCNIIH